MILLPAFVLPPVHHVTVMDTFIDQKEPESNYGRDRLLSGGPGKVVFLRFGNLNQVLADDEEFDSVQLQMRQALGRTINVTGIYRVRQDWEEGNDLRGEINAKLGFPSDQPVTGLTWRQNTTGDLTPIAEAKAKVENGVLTVDGLGKLVNQWRTGEAPSFGLALTFGEVVDFPSSEAREQGPQLKFTVRKHGRADNRRITEVRRNGANVEFSVDWGKAGPITPRVWQGGLEISAAKLGATQFQFALPLTGGPVSIALPGADAVAQDNSWTLYPLGKDFAAAEKNRAAIRAWNEVCAPFSRYSFARAGATVRLNHWTSADLLPGQTLEQQIASINERLGLLAGGMSVDDVEFARQLPLSSAPWPDELADQVAFAPVGLLSAAAVGQLNQPTKTLPKNIALKVVGPDGLPLAGIAKLEDGAKHKVVTLNGSLQLINLSEITTSLTGPSLRLSVVTPNGETTISVAREEFFVAALRAGTRLPVVKIGVPIPMAKLEEGTNLALAKIVGDSANTDPAKLNALVDGDPATRFMWTPEVKWIELNLGRDRVFGSVDILTANPGQLTKIEVGARETAQAFADSEPFAKMLQPGWHAASWCPKEGDVAVLRLLGAPLKARTIRIYFEGASVEIAEIRVTPAKVAP
ncbi:MAG: hypothetical protein JNJ45_08175 [Chthonomonas sp.]|nr:hypothetical protein [Chthonomonas sp.]